MDGERFDALTRLFGNEGTRRGLLRGAAGSALAWLGLTGSRARAADKNICDPVENPCQAPAPVACCKMTYPAGTTGDDYLCIDTSSDDRHCGDCSRPCDPRLEVCDHGNCCPIAPDCTGKICGPPTCPDTGCGPCPPYSTCNADGTACDCDFLKCGEACCANGQVCHQNACCTPRVVCAPGSCDYVSDGCGGRYQCTGCGPSGRPGPIKDTVGVIGCPAGEQFCAAKSRCVPCPAGMVLDGTCACVCQTESPTRCETTCECPKVASCHCVCPSISCPAPKIQDPNNCFCRCPEGCPPLQEQDQKTCRCLCPREQELCEITRECITCPSGRVLDQRTCQCVCPFATCGGECCPEGYVCDASASPPACCQPRGACPTGFCGTISDRCGGQIACVCDRDQTCCDTNCVDTLTDREHCGRCGNVCPEGSGCQDGICQCEGGVVCGGVCRKGSECCVDADCPDPGPCGSRGCFADPSGTRTCLSAFAADGARCPDGICCAGICLPGKNCCGDEHCTPPDTCQDNVCACIPAVACPGGFCGPVTDSCGNRADCRCAAGQTCCGRTCVDTLTSPDNCGACGAPCAPGEACVNGACRRDDEGCPPGEQQCRGECVPCAAGWTLDPDTCECSCPTVLCAGVCCAAGQVCNRELPGQCCTPRAICANNACGESPDGCGGVFELPPCPEQVCVYSVCQEGNPCSTCAFGVALAGRPGPLCDGPGQFCCGTSCCAAGQVCANTGCCTPRGVCPAGYCGTVDNGCGGQLLCACGPGLNCCGGRCVDTSSSSTNCGGCGASCQGFPCRSGICDEREGCPAGYQLCNRECIACPAEGKLDANCRCRCPRNKTLCQGRCVDRCPANRPLNPLTCTCGCPRGTTLCPGKNLCVPCPPGRRLNARCECVCPIGQTLCQDRCVDLCSTEQPLDPVTCECGCPAGRAKCQGRCCAQGQVCNKTDLLNPCCTPAAGPWTGNCCGSLPDGCGGIIEFGACAEQVCQTVSCPAGQDADTGDFAGVQSCTICAYSEVPDGTQGPLCNAASEACCGGVCANTKTDPANCGGCGKPCPAGRVCKDGKCGCGCVEFACFLRNWATDCKKDGRFSPASLAISPDGLIYAVGSQNANVQVFTADGACQGNFVGGITEELTYTSMPHGVAVDSKGWIYVTDRLHSLVRVFDEKGNLLDQWGGQGSDPGKFASPSGIAVAPDGTIYVADNNNHRVQYFDRALGIWQVLVDEFGKPVVFDDPTSIAIAPDGTIYVTEEGSNLVRYFDKDRKPKGQWGGFGTGNGQFRKPLAITVGPDGTVYVVDRDQFQVHAFGPTGTYLGRWGSLGQGDGQFGHYALGVTVAPDGTVYVADTSNGRIQAFCINRPLLPGTGTGTPGATAGTVPTGTPTPIPTSTPTPTPAEVPATATPTPAPTSTPAPEPTATPTPAGPPDCADDELRCANTCIPATECPVASCCLDAATCACTCLDCNANQVFDSDDCTCECMLGECPANYVFDEIACTCTCQPPACQPNFVFDDASCACVCPLTECAPNHVWDREACTCTCVPQECPANQVFDASRCGCVCGLGGCPPNYVFDEANCACICAAQCPPTFRFDEATCSCVCELAGCPPNLTFDPGSCACFCAPPVCPPGFVVDQASCACFCPEVACGEGQVFDPTSCACVQSGAGAAVGESG